MYSLQNKEALPGTLTQEWGALTPEHLSTTCSAISCPKYKWWEQTRYLFMLTVSFLTYVLYSFVVFLGGGGMAVEPVHFGNYFSRISYQL